MARLTTELDCRTNGKLEMALPSLPIPESVALPNVFAQLKEGVFAANELNIAGASAMLSELRKWEEALRDLRARHRATALAG